MVIGDISFAMLIVMCLILNMQMTMMEEEAETTTPAAANVTTTTTAKMIDDAPMVNIVILYVLQGIGRACFEGPYVYACGGLYNQCMIDAVSRCELHMVDW